MDERAPEMPTDFLVILALGCGAYAQQRPRVAVQAEDLSSLLQALREMSASLETLSSRSKRRRRFLNLPSESLEPWCRSS